MFFKISPQQSCFGSICDVGNVWFLCLLYLDGFFSIFPKFVLFLHSNPVLAAFAMLGMFGFFVFRAANSQKGVYTPIYLLIYIYIYVCT